MQAGIFFQLVMKVNFGCITFREVERRGLQFTVGRNGTGRSTAEIDERIFHKQIITHGFSAESNVITRACPCFFFSHPMHVVLGVRQRNGSTEKQQR